MKIGAGIASALFFALPFSTFAQIQITEVMYDVPGSDSGREWLEVTNTGSESVDIGKYKFFENEVNHGLKLVAGTATLSPGASGVFASNAEKFLADHPQFSGTLFDTAFSLSNTGESLAIKNASGTIVQRVTYTALNDANGTGGSLQLKDASFVAALPTPGVYPGSFAPVPKPEVIEKTVGKKSGSTSPSKNSKKSLHATSTIISGADSPLSQSAAVGFSFNWLPDWWPWAAGMFAVILAGVGGVLFLLSREPETSPPAEEFTIE